MKTQSELTEINITVDVSTFDRISRKLFVSGLVFKPNNSTLVEVTIPNSRKELITPESEALLACGNVGSISRWSLDVLLEGTDYPDMLLVNTLPDGLNEALRIDVEDQTDPRISLSVSDIDMETGELWVMGWSAGKSKDDTIRISLDGQRLPEPHPRPRRDVEARHPWLLGTLPGFETRVMITCPFSEARTITAELIRGKKTIAYVEKKISLTGKRSPYSHIPARLSAALNPAASDATLRSLAQGLTPAGRKRLLASRAFRRLWAVARYPVAITLRKHIVRTMLSKGEVNGPLNIRIGTGDLVKADPCRDMVIARRFLLDGNYENGVIGWLQENLRSGQIAFDVGACYGHISMAMARAVGRRGHVVSIEANPKIAQGLQDVFHTNGYDNITLIEKAVGSTSKTATLLSLDGINLGGSRILARATKSALQAAHEKARELTIVSMHEDTLGRPIPVPSNHPDMMLSQRIKMTTLDTLVKKTGYVPDIVKMDIEGAELIALKGAPKLLSGKFGKKPMFILEYSELIPTLGGTKEEIFDIFTTCGYTAFKFQYGKSRGGPLLKIKSATDAPEHDDLVFLPSLEQ